MGFLAYCTVCLCISVSAVCLFASVWVFFEKYAGNIIFFINASSALESIHQALRGLNLTLMNTSSLITPVFKKC